MRKTILSFTLLVALAGVPALHAASAEEVTTRVTPRAVQPVGELRLAPVQAEQRVSASETAETQVARRGSFWWLVGAIVVGGVILAILI